MSDDLYLQHLQSLEAGRSQLLEGLARLQQQRDLEENVKQQMQQEQAIAEIQLKLRQLNEEIVQHGLREARKYRLKQSYSKALHILRYVAVDNSDHPEMCKALAELEVLEQQSSKVSGLVTKLSCTQNAKLREIRRDVADALKQVDDSNRYRELSAKVAQMDGQASIEDFLFWWEFEYPMSGNATADFSDEAKIGVAERIRAGNMVLFLGSGVSGMAAQETELANQLAQQAKYADFAGSLSSIAEYYRLKLDSGVDKLLKKMNAILPDDAQAVTFYQILATIPARLVLISAAYDDLLEQAFAQAGKPFVTLTSIIQKDKHEVGHVQVSFSDDNPEAGVYPKERTSELKLENYSIIYKIRGTCRTGHDDATTLTLTESDYFSFARHAETMIPDCLASPLRNVLLFIGYHPRQWEDRLLVKALLKKRENARESCFRLVMPNVEPLEDEFWKRRNVQKYPMDVRELERYLQRGGV